MIAQIRQDDPVVTGQFPRQRAEIGRKSEEPVQQYDGALTIAMEMMIQQRVRVQRALQNLQTDREPAGAD